MKIRLLNGFNLLVLVMIVVAGQFLVCGELSGQDQYRPDTVSRETESDATDQNASAAETPGEVTIQKIQDGEWKIINKHGDFVGTLKSDSKITFRLYDTSGLSMGRIIESGIWYPRQSRKRDTKVNSREAFLYLDALDAIKLIQSE